MARLQDKVCVITGAAGGIAGAAAAAYIEEGAFVGLLDLDTPRLHEYTSELGANAFALPCDVTQESSVQAAFAEVEKRHSRLDVLYTCAAIQLIGEDGPVQDLSTEVWDRTYAVNARGVFLCCKYGARLMIKAGNGGSIINAGSPTGLTVCGAEWPAYSSTKAAVMGLTRAMAGDLAQYGIRVNGIVPGSITTPLTKVLHEDPVVGPQIAALHPIGRLGKPKDMAGIAVFLASDESSFATASHFYVDGGISTR
jgi:NAD(P)-dependent dehydrogenase (short-subunit alcohol dehydrogenase family)